MTPPTARTFALRGLAAVLAALSLGVAFFTAAVAGRAADPVPVAAASGAGADEPRASRLVPLEAPAPAPAPVVEEEPAAPPWPEIEWRRSKALGLPWDGSLVNGVELPREGPTFFTWDPVRKVSPNPRWRRYGTDRLVRTVLTVLDEYAAANPGAPRATVGDLSRPQGGPFYPTHRSHQNGLDVDVYYPRLDRQERAPGGPEDVDWALAQDLVDRFVAAGAEFVFVGPRTGLKGPPAVVQVLAYHDRHLHVRIPGR